MLTVVRPSKDHTYIVGEDGLTLVTVIKREHVECVKAALESYIAGEDLAPDAAPSATEPRPCRHEWYQGMCAHCEMPASEYRALMAARVASYAAPITLPGAANRSPIAPPEVGPQGPVADDPKEILAGRLIDAWCEDKGRKIPWAKAVQIVAIVTGQSDAERDRLLKMGDEDGSCEMCGRRDFGPCKDCVNPANCHALGYCRQHCSPDMNSARK